MGTIITLASDRATVIITGDGVYTGCTYDRLEGWYGVAGVDVGFEKRPAAPGAYAPIQTFPGERVISIEGQFFGASRAAALRMREDLAGLYNDGEPITMTVADDLRTTSRLIYIDTVDFPWTIHPEFNWTIDAKAPDPRRYGDERPSSASLASSSGVGLTYPLVYPLNYGAAPVNSRLVTVNDGNTETYTRFVVTVTGGEMPDGFDLVNLTTGERLSYIGPVVAGTPITLDPSTQTAYIAGSATGGRYLASPQWWGVPAKSSVEVQFVSRGAVTGTPRVEAFTAPAFY